MKPQKLTLKGVRAAARKAYRAGTLTAQNPFLELCMCAYELLPSSDTATRYRCAIGVSLTPETLAYIHKKRANRWHNVKTLYNWGVLAFANSHELAYILQIQTLHDTWALARKYGDLEGPPRFRFLQAIGIRS